VLQTICTNDAATAGPDGHANADLADLLRDVVRHDAVHADGAKQKGDNPERRDEDGLKALALDRPVQYVRERTRAGDRLRRVLALSSSAHSRYKASGIGQSRSEDETD
jgi:hypothetical protein